MPDVRFAITCALDDGGEAYMNCYMPDVWFMYPACVTLAYMNRSMMGGKHTCPSALPSSAVYTCTHADLRARRTQHCTHAAHKYHAQAQVRCMHATHTRRATRPASQESTLSLYLCAMTERKAHTAHHARASDMPMQTPGLVGQIMQGFAPKWSYPRLHLVLAHGHRWHPKQVLSIPSKHPNTHPPTEALA